MVGKKRPQQPQVPRVEVPASPPVVLPKLGWKSEWRGSTQLTSISVRTLVDDLSQGHYRLPKFQRPFVWSDEETIFLLDSILRGYHIGTLFLWQQHHMPASVENIGGIEVQCPEGRCSLVVDGQQRLGSIARAFLSEMYSFHLITGKIEVDSAPGPYLCPLSVIRYGALQHPVHGRLWQWGTTHAETFGLNTEVVTELACMATDALRTPVVSFCYLDARWELDEVMEVFRRINSTGRPFSEEDLKSALERVRS